MSPKKHTSRCRDTLGCHNWEGVTPWHVVARFQGCCKYTTAYKSSPTAEFSGPNVQGKRSLDPKDLFSGILERQGVPNHLPIALAGTPTQVIIPASRGSPGRGSRMSGERIAKSGTLSRGVRGVGMLMSGEGPSAPHPPHSAPFRCRTGATFGTCTLKGLSPRAGVTLGPERRLGNPHGPCSFK